MRVLVVCDFFLKYGAEQALGLADLGEDVAVLCRTHVSEFGNDAAERLALLDAVRGRGVEVFELPGRLRSVETFLAIRRLHAAIKTWSPDIAHVHDNHDPRLALLTRGIPTVLTIHDPTPHHGAEELRGLRAQVRRAWLRRACLIIVHGERLRVSLAAAEHPQAAIAVTPHGAKPFPAALPVPNQPRVLLFGRLEPYKGVGVLLAAMEIVWRSRPTTKLVIAGRGPDRARVPRDPRIEFRDEYVPEGELDELFSNVSLAVLPYVEASQSGAGIDSLRRGIPTIVTDVGSLPDLVHDAAFVVPAGDSVALAEAILKHLGHDYALRCNVLEEMRRLCSWDSVARSSVALYTEVLQNPAAGPKVSQRGGASSGLA